MSNDALVDALFRDLVLSARRRPERTAFGWSISVTTHIVLVSTLLLVPLLWPTALPEVAPPWRVVAMGFAPPAGTPLGGTRSAKNSQAMRAVSPKPAAAAPPTVETPSGAETPPIPDPQAGSATASLAGDPNGVTQGGPGGEPGGVPEGQPGGCITCFGENPVSDYDQAPQLLVRTLPSYPQEAFVNKLEGTVVLEILIDSAGNVTSARVTRSMPVFDQAARACVLQWKFKPARKQGRSVATLAGASVTFKIH